MADFEPRIVTFCCNWCSYAGADGAGVARLQMPTNFRIIRTGLVSSSSFSMGQNAFFIFLLPAGLITELTSKLNSKTKGNAAVKAIQ